MSGHCTLVTVDECVEVGTHTVHSVSRALEPSTSVNATVAAERAWGWAVRGGGRRYLHYLETI